MSEFDDIQERLVGAVEEVAEHLNRHSAQPCTAAEISSVLLAKEVNWLTLSMNRQVMALDDIAEQALVIGKALEALLEQIVLKQEVH